MPVLTIRLFPDPVLRVQCPKVTEFDDTLWQLAQDMVTTMHAAPGVGLAAPQVGIATRLAVVDVSAGEDAGALHVLVNPEIVEAAGEELDREGCLSIPDLTESVKRPVCIHVRAQALDGSDLEIEATDFFARAICHEIDHLDGVLFVDHLRGLRRDRARRFLKRMARQQESMQPQMDAATGP
jgi:peptide deformylase